MYNQVYTSGNSCTITIESDKEESDDDEVLIGKSSLAKYEEKAQHLGMKIIEDDEPDYNYMTLVSKTNKNSIETRSQVAL